MATPKRKLPKVESNVNILELHEVIFRELFRHLQCETVYFTMRRVCRKLKYYVDEYIQLRGMFMIAAGRGNPTQILYLFQQKNNAMSIFSKIAQPYPYPPVGFYKSGSSIVVTDTRVKAIGSFGAIMNGKIVVGINFLEYKYGFKTRTSGDKSAGEKYVCNINEFNPKDNKWSVVELNDDASINGYRDGVKLFCPIGDSKLLLLDGGFSGRLTHTIPLHILRLNCADSNIATNQITCSSDLIAFSSPSQSPRDLIYTTLTRVAHDKIMLIGGLRLYNVATTDRFNRFLWQGTITNIESDQIDVDRGNRRIEWEQIEVEIPKVRLWPICFKLKDNLYIAGGEEDISAFNDEHSSHGSSELVVCDQYNLQERKYYRSEHVLPYPAHSGSITNISTDSDESFAIFVHNNGQIIIFTEDRGFEHVPYFSAKETHEGRVLLKLK